MVDCCSAPGLLPFEEALTKMLAAISPVTESEEVNVAQALSRTLAEDVLSPINVPPHNNSAMDGYAFAYSSFEKNQTLTLAGRSMAGNPFQGECPAGHCIRIMTGAKMPKNCDTVEMQENCEVITVGHSDEEIGNQVSFLSSKNVGANVRYAGEDIRCEQSVFSQGRKVSAVDVGVLASLGVPKVKVYRKLTVALLATGDELKTANEVLTEGDIFESNSHALEALLTKLGVKVLNFGIIKDDETKIREAFIKADSVADVVISSGGVSVGDADYTKVILDELGKINFWKIAIKPGKPFAFGTLPNSYFFGLPGNPVSALVTAHVLAIPALHKLQNTQHQAPQQFQAISEDSLRKSPGRIDFQRGVVSCNEQGKMVVKSTGGQGSGILTSLAQANCYIVLAQEQGRVSAGENVTVQLFDSLFS